MLHRDRHLGPMIGYHDLTIGSLRTWNLSLARCFGVTLQLFSPFAFLAPSGASALLSILQSRLCSLNSGSLPGGDVLLPFRKASIVRTPDRSPDFTASSSSMPNNRYSYVVVLIVVPFCLCVRQRINRCHTLLWAL